MTIDLFTIWLYGAIISLILCILSQYVHAKRADRQDLIRTYIYIFTNRTLVLRLLTAVCAWPLFVVWCVFIELFDKVIFYDD